MSNKMTQDIEGKVAAAIRARDSQDEFALARAAIEAYQEAIWPVHHFTDKHVFSPQLRHHKANALTAHVMSVIGKHLCEHGDQRGHKEAARALFQMFYESGADIITDADRAVASLPMRGPYGLTAEELHILESRRITAMLEPIPPMIVSRSSSFLREKQ